MTNDKIQKTYQMLDEADDVWRDIYESPGIEGTTITVEVPREDQKPNVVRKYFFRKGALAALLENDETLEAAIAMEAPVVRRAAHTGWRDSNATFVSYCHVATGQEEGTILPPKSPLGRTANQLQICGTLAGWQKTIAVAQYSTAMLVALCSAFAAPLLALVRRPSFALVLFGPSRSGKSTAQTVAGSVVGFGQENDLPSLDATHAGLIATALAANDHLLPINEVATARGTKRDTYSALREATYSLMSGRDVQRHPSWSGDSGTASFQVICLFSSEHSPDVWAARNGETRDDGEMARLIGVPVVAAGRDSVFDRPPTAVAVDARAEWQKVQFGQLLRGLPNNRGVAFRDYVDALQQDVERYTVRAQHWIAYFEKGVAKPQMSAVARDIVGKFGLLLAGGLIAEEIGILRFSQDRLAGKKIIGEAVRRACDAALAALPDPEAETKDARRILKERLSGGSVLDAEDVKGRKIQLLLSADGYHETEKTGRRYVLRAQVFMSWFKTPLQAARILDWLNDEGFLVHKRERKTARSNEWAQTQVTWLDGTRQRSICLFFPVSLDSIDVN